MPRQRKSGKKKHPRLISDWTLFVVKFAVNVGNLLFWISPCSWNWKRKRFQTDKSTWNFVCRCIHLGARICMLFLVPICWLYFPRLNIVDLLLSISLEVMLLVMISIHIKGFKNTRYLASAFNGIVQINREYGRLRDEDIAKQKSLEFYLNTLMCLGAMTVGLFPFGVYAFIAAEFSEILTSGVDILAFILGIPNEFRFIIYIFFSFCLLVLGGTEITLWGTYSLSLDLYTNLACYCLETYKFHCQKHDGEVKQANQLYCNLRTIGNIIGYTLFTSYYLAFILLKQLLIVCMLFFVIKYFDLFRKEGYEFVAFLVSLLLIGVGNLIDDWHVSKNAFLVTKKSMLFKTSFAQVYYQKYEQRLIKSWQPMKFDVAETLEFDGTSFLILLKDFTFNILITLLCSY